jgi:hypothetical protein
MSHTADKFIETDVSSYVQHSPINNRKDTFVSSVIMNSVRSRFIHATLYSYCYVCSGLHILFTSCQLAFFGYPDWGFSVPFPQLYGKCQRITCKDGARPALFPITNLTVLFYILFVSTVLFYVLFVCKCVLYYCHWVATQLQLTNISHITTYPLRSVLPSLGNWGRSAR